MSGTEKSLVNLIGQQQANQNQAFGLALPEEENIATQGTGILPQLTDLSSGTTAQGFAPAQGSLDRNLASAGINQDSAAGVQAQNDLNAQEGNSLTGNLLTQLMNNFAAKSGATSNMLNFGQAQNPLQALGLLLNAQMNA